MDLTELRQELLHLPSVVASIEVSKNDISYRDLVVSCVFLFCGIAGHLYSIGISPLLAGLSFLLQVAGIAGFTSLQHEAWHQRAVPTNRMNRLIGTWIIAPLFFSDFDQLSKAHMLHHRNFGDSEDPDAPVWHQSTKQFVVTQAKRWLIVPAVYELALRLLRADGGRNPAFRSHERMRFGTIGRIALFHGIWVTAVLAAAWYAVLTAYLLPLLAGLTLVNFREFREHAYLPDGNFLVFDTECPEWERLMIAGGYFNLHAIHHLFPEVPQRQLPAIWTAIRLNVDARDRMDSCVQVARHRSYFDGFEAGRYAGNVN